MSRLPLAEMILALLDSHHLLTAPDLVEKLHAQGHDVHKTSVYRNLETLVSKGSIFRHSIGDQHVVYELRRHHHDHLVCTSCGKVESVECQVHLPENVGKKNGFEVEFHNLTIFGHCKSCHGDKPRLSQASHHH